MLRLLSRLAYRLLLNILVQLNSIIPASRPSAPVKPSHYQSEFYRPARFKNSKSAQRFCRNLAVRRGEDRRSGSLLKFGTTEESDQ